MMPFLDEIINEPTLTIAISAVIVSICSIVIAVVSLWIQRKHNRITVRPVADIGRFNYVGWIAIWVKNVGLGPMIVKSIETYDPQKGIIKDYPIDWMKGKMPSGFYFTRFRKNLEDSTIMAGDHEVLLEYEYNTSDPFDIENATQIRSILKDLKIRIKYENFYEEEQPEFVKSLDWFGINL